MNPDGDESRDREAADKEGGRRDRQRTELGVDSFLAEEGWIHHEAQPLRSGRGIVLAVVRAPKVAHHDGGDGGVQNHEERDCTHHAAALVPEQSHARAAGTAADGGRDAVSGGGGGGQHHSNEQRADQ